MSTSTQDEVIIPYVSYITLGIVVLTIVLMVLIKLAARDDRFLSNSELYIYSRPETNQRKNNANKKQRKNTFLTPKTTSITNGVLLSD
jgi:hypothetical protein